MKRIRLEAYAKINLFLDVKSKLDNGFHTIESVMQTISLADVVDICAEESDRTEINVFCESGYAPNGEDNIVYQAAKVYLDNVGITAKVSISLDKRIPSPAGMGGGSADAAAVLRGLNVIFERLDTDALEALAASIGSDVSFCVCGGTQLATGRGEVLSECMELPDCFIVIACGEEKIKTPYAYKMLDEKYENFTIAREKSGIEDFLSSISDLYSMSKALYNIFEEVAMPLCGSIEDLKNAMTSSGASGTLMCGSGPAVFGIFDDEASAVKAVAKIKSNGNFAALCKPVKAYLK